MMSRLLPWVSVCLVLAAAGCGGGGGGASSAPTTLTFNPSSIVYGSAAAAGAAYNVTEMTPTGASPVQVAKSVPDSIQLFAINPAVVSQLALAADPTGAGSYGIYLSSKLSLTGATTLVAAAYTYVSSITVTENGQFVVYSAIDSTSGLSNLYVVPVTGGTPVEYGLSDGSTVSPVDSDTIAYVAPVNGVNDEVFTRSLAGGAAGASTQLTSDPSDHLLPAFSPNGLLLAYWSGSNALNTLSVNTLSTNTAVAVSVPAGIQGQGEAFSADSSTIVFAGDLNGSGVIDTAPATNSGSSTNLVTSPSLLGNYGVFWTDANGRTAGGIGGMSSAAHRQRLVRQ